MQMTVTITRTSVLSHLKDRHMDVELHRPVIDEDNRLATFFLWNLSGQMVGYHQYRPDSSKKAANSPKEGRYFTLKRNMTHAVWGIESLSLSSKCLFLTEGIFDAARLTKRGVSSIAVLCNNPGKDFRNWLFALGKKVIAVTDSDKAGEMLASYSCYNYRVKSKDLGDSSEDEVTHLINKYSLFLK